MALRGNNEVRVTVAPVRAAASAASWATKPAHHLLGALLGMDLLNLAEAPGHGDHVDGGVAAADADHLLRRDLQSAGVERAQQLHAAHAVRRIAAGHRQGRPLWQPMVQRMASWLLLQLFDADVAADTGIELRFHITHVENALDLVIEKTPRRAVAGDPIAQHAAEFLVLVVNGAGVTHAPQLIGGTQTRRAAADDGNPFAAFLFGLLSKAKPFSLA